MSVTMHRPCMTSYKSVNPTTKHLSLVRHGHLRCLPSLPETSTEGTEIYAMSAIKMQSDMISTCFNLDTQNWCLQMCIIEQTCEIISHATLSSLWTGSYTYVVSVILVWNISWHHCHDLGLCETLYKENWDLHKQAHSRTRGSIGTTARGTAWRARTWS